MKRRVKDAPGEGDRMPPGGPGTTGPGAKYTRYLFRRDADGKPLKVAFNVYDVLRTYRVDCSAVAHAVKKLLMPGQRGGKTRLQDLQEALVSVEEAIRLEIELSAMSVMDAP